MINNFKSIFSYRQYASFVMHSSRFLWTADISEFLDSVLQSGRNQNTPVPKDTILWRAQLGHSMEPFIVGQKLAPFPAVRMKPQLDRAKEGRANPKGIPYLYMADEKETAMSEVRPGLESLISVAELKVLKDIRIIDFTTGKNVNFSFVIFEHEPVNIDEFVWSDIGYSFSKPVNPSDDLAEYIPTQIIAELFKNNGFDGLKYNSAFGKGHNILLFDINCTELISRTLFKTEKITLEFKQIPGNYYSRGKTIDQS